jgi:hypothetical protein
MGHTVAVCDLLSVLHTRAIVLTSASGREGGQFLPQPHQYPHFAVDGAVQSAFLTQQHAPRFPLRSEAGLPCYRRALLIRLFRILEFFPHAGDFLIEQTQKLLVFRLPRRLAVEACFAYELQFLPLGLLRVEVQRVAETVHQPENQRLSPPRHTLVKRFQHGVLALPEGALLDLVSYDFKKGKGPSQPHPSIRRPG